MSRTLTEPPTSRRMWKRFLRATHPDSAGGSADLFIWVENLRSYVLSDEPEEPPRQARRDPPRHHSPPSGGRIPFEDAPPFADLTLRALAMAEGLDQPYATLLGLLADCAEAGPNEPMQWRQQQVAATYRSLAALAYRAGLSKEERIGLYEVARAVPLSQRHVGHLLSRI